MKTLCIQEALDKLKNLTEDNWVDEETGEKFYDYETGTIENPPEDVFDVTTTGTSFYDKLLPSSSEEDKKNMKKYKNLEGKIMYLSPREYYNICAKDIFNRNSEELEKSREVDSSVNDHINKVVLKYHRQLPITYINYANGGQEGLHRMQVLAKTYGWDVKYPVLIVDWADKDLQSKLTDEKTATVYDRIRYICDDLLKYEYDSIEQLIQNIENELTAVKHEITKNNDGSVLVTVLGVDYLIPSAEIKLTQKKQPDDLENIDKLISEMDLEF